MNLHKSRFSTVANACILFILSGISNDFYLQILDTLLFQLSFKSFLPIFFPMGEIRSGILDKKTYTQKQGKLRALQPWFKQKIFGKTRSQCPDMSLRAQMFLLSFDLLLKKRRKIVLLRSNSSRITSRTSPFKWRCCLGY